MSTQQKPLILVDGSSYLYRAFHALPPLTNSKGQPTGAIYGMINMLKRLITDYQPDHMAVIFDAKGKTFRDELYPAYKATRQEMPVELISQIKPLHEIIRAMGIPLVMIEGVEADDVIGTMASTINMPVVISTGDKDLAQLVTNRVSLINTMTNTTLDPKGVEEKFGVPPERIIDYLTLVGDTSDNIPGVPQVGPKTAAKWLKEYASLDNIIANADKITGKVGDNLRASLAQIPLTKTLVTIKCDVSLPVSYNDLKIVDIDKEKLIEQFKSLEFKSWLAELQGVSKTESTSKYAGYEIITTKALLKQWVDALNNAKIISVDTETTSLDYMTAKLVGISFAITPGKAAYIPFGHDYENAPAQLSYDEVITALKPILENNQIKKIGQNIKYDIEVFANAGIVLNGIEYDTMLESYVLESGSNSHDMDSLALKYLGWQTITYTDVAGKGAKQIPFNHVDIQKAGIYAAEDADVTLRLHQTLYPRVTKEAGLNRVFTEIEMPLVPVLARMERTGVLIDPDKLKKQGKALQERLLELEKNAYDIAGTSFNLNSPKQLQEILFEKLNLPVLQKTPTGQASTADGVLQELAIDFEMPRIIIEYRSLSKLISTYTNRLVEQINSETKRIHTSYNQTGTATGRLSSSEPNLQNIPVRSSEGRKIRQAFIAPKGCKIISADYSQIELRLMAHISEDAGLLKAFANNLDVHKATAAEVFGVSLEDVTSDMRRDAKAINFGLLYGMSAFGLTQQLGIDRNAAQAYIDRYFARYPGVRQYMESTRSYAKERGYVETLWGRRLYLPEINARQIPRQKASERTAINAPLQGSAADIIKLAMIHIDQWLQSNQTSAKMIMQVHDELVFEVAEDEAHQLAEQIRRYMSEVVTLRVPLLVSVGIGDNWDAASAH